MTRRYLIAALLLIPVCAQLPPLTPAEAPSSISAGDLTVTTTGKLTVYGPTRDCTIEEESLFEKREREREAADEAARKANPKALLFIGTLGVCRDQFSATLAEIDGDKVTIAPDVSPEWVVGWLIKFFIENQKRQSEYSDRLADTQSRAVQNYMAANKRLVGSLKKQVAALETAVALYQGQNKVLSDGLTRAHKSFADLENKLQPLLPKKAGR